MFLLSPTQPPSNDGPQNYNPITCNLYCYVFSFPLERLHIINTHTWLLWLSVCWVYSHSPRVLHLGRWLLNSNPDLTTKLDSTPCVHHCLRKASPTERYLLMEILCLSRRYAALHMFLTCWCNGSVQSRVLPMFLTEIWCWCCGYLVFEVNNWNVLLL